MNWAEDRMYADPSDLAINSFLNRFGSDPANANDSVVIKRANSPHTVVDPEHTALVRISSVGSFVDQNSHMLLSNARQLIIRNFPHRIPIRLLCGAHHATLSV